MQKLAIGKKKKKKSQQLTFIVLELGIEKDLSEILHQEFTQKTAHNTEVWRESIQSAKLLTKLQKL